jgi:polar amino acid transport system ATP-binding protein/sulfate transport system ATP-binding protein
MRGLGMKKASARADALLEEVGLQAKGDLYPAQLSGGQRQRAAVAQQLVVPRRLLLLDEPFSGLDPRAVSEIGALIGRVANEDELNTIVLVTHDVRAALRVSDTVLLLGGAGSGRGARVVEHYDLCARGLAWGQGTDDARAALEREIVARFDGGSHAAA